MHRTKKRGGKHGLKESWSNGFLIAAFTSVVILGLTFGLQAFYTRILLRQIASAESGNLAVIESEYQGMNHNLINISYQLANSEIVEEVFRQGDKLTYAQLQRLTKEISRQARAMPYVESIYLLNTQGKSIYFSTRSLMQAVEFENDSLYDQEIFRYLADFAQYRYKLPLNRSVRTSPGIAETPEVKNLLTYIYSPQPLSAKSLKYAVVINASIDQFGKRLEELGPLAITLIVERGQVVASSDPGLFPPGVRLEGLAENGGPPKTKDKIWTLEIEGEKRLGLGKQIGDTAQWCVRFVPYAHVVLQVKTAQSGIAAICLIVLGVSLALSAALSVRVAAPIARLQKQCEGFKKNEERSAGFFRHEYIKHLLTDKNFVASELYAQKQSELDLKVDLEQPCQILNFAFDVREIETKDFYEKIRGFRETLQWTIEETLRPFHYEICAVSAWRYAAVVQKPKEHEVCFERLCQGCRAVQRTINRELGLDVTVAMAEYRPPAQSLFEAYQHTQALLNYRVSFGCGEILTDQTMERVKPTRYECFCRRKQELRAGLCRAGGCGQEEAREKYRALLQEILYFCYEDFTACVIDLALELTGILEAYERPGKAQFRMADFTVMIQQAQTSYQIDNAFYFLLSLLETLRGKDPRMHTRMKEIENYIETHYADPELSVNSLAGRYRISTGYLGQSFAAYSGTSLPNYISSVRVRQSQALLKSSDLSVAEIAQQVGFSSHKYFCRVFKSMTGVTPKGYRQQVGTERKGTNEL